MTAISGFSRKPRRVQKDSYTLIKPQVVPDFVLGKFNAEHLANLAGTKIQKSMVTESLENWKNRKEPFARNAIILIWSHIICTRFFGQMIIPCLMLRIKWMKFPGDPEKSNKISIHVAIKNQTSSWNLSASCVLNSRIKWWFYGVSKPKSFWSLNLEEIQEIRNPEQIIEKNHFTAHVACERKREDQNLLRFP